MLLSELKNKFIKPLPRSEKLQLIQDITKMLQEEEGGAELFFAKKATYPVFTPNIEPNDTSCEAAYQLQKLLEGKDKR